jgi:hypothetical protein
MDERGQDLVDIISKGGKPYALPKSTAFRS